MTAILGGAVLGAWRGPPALADGAFGLVCAAVLTAYLLSLRAGRALVGVVAVLAVFLALRSPQAAAGVVLAERGRVESAVVTSIEDGWHPAGRPRRLCTVQDSDGAVLPVRIWRGCEGRTRPGDVLAVLYDPEGRLPPRGAGSGASVGGSLAGVAGCVAALVLGCLVAVVRSHRLVHAVPAFREPAR
ncbi:hypothetical protein [Streptomyces anandii]|uniref:hypothetical protein n=1 Tax=Streptomyces anandii TaxID=285454 RepID=UPI001E3CCBA0|nr:hypothetical protein [Streptomyces anandii]